MAAVWKEPAELSNSKALPTIFLDRDGVLIREMDYLDDPDKVEILHGVAEALTLAREEGFQLIGLSNQSGIGRGLFSEVTFGKVMTRMEEILAEAGAFLDGFYFCPHEPAKGCACRKPAGGLLEEASASFNWDPARTWVIGDKCSDVDLGRRAGFGTFLVLTGHGVEQEEEVRARFSSDPQVRIVADLSTAVAVILGKSEAGNPP
ncbi:MAG: HAD family hydrolase [Gemmatimonadales bacterium]|nr:HAD family hydrolase [Gemmatimonadales bacterium]